MSEIFYNNNDVLVDQTRYVVAGKTFPINSIASVDIGSIDNNKGYIVTQKKEPPSWAGALIIGGVGLIMVTSFTSMWLIVLGLLVIAFAAFAWLPVKEEGYQDTTPVEYTVKITTSAGESDSYTSLNKGDIIEIVEAINGAIIARG